MKRFFIIALLLASNCVALKAQFFCEVDESEDINIVHHRDMRTVKTDGPYHVKVFFHIIKRADGTGDCSLQPQDISQCLQVLNNDFAPFNITFDSLGLDYIYNDRYYNWPVLSDSEYAQLVRTNHHTNTIDIYLRSKDLLARARANSIPGRAIVIEGDTTNRVLFACTSALSHEMGHCFGLYHTFHGSRAENTEHGHPVGCPELVNGTNCDTCGDYVCDTPADPYYMEGYNSNDCTWNNTDSVDANGQYYAPDTRQIMAYVPTHCRQHFSEGQGERMMEFIRYAEVLEDRVLPAVIYLQNEVYDEYRRDRYYQAFDSIVVGRNVTTGTIGDVEVLNEGTLYLIAEKKIHLKPGFKVDSGAYFYADIDAGLPIPAHHGKKSENIYLPMLENTSWTSIEITFEPIFGYLLSNLRDTVIEDKTYRIIQQERLELTEVDRYARSFYFLREDVVNERVYKYNTQKQTEELMYDFALQVGDVHPKDSSYIVSDISLIENAGITRRKYTFRNASSDSIIWIEGIGNYNDLMVPHYRANAWDAKYKRVLCAQKGQETTYDLGLFYYFTCDGVKNKIIDFIEPIEHIPAPSSSATKILRDGQLYILREGKTYTATGMELR